MDTRQKAIAEVFGRAISHISEEIWAAQWYSGIEYGLWEATQGMETWHGDYYKEWQALGQLLLEVSGGMWIEYQGDYYSDYRLVPMDEWLLKYEAWKIGQ